jgi:hypothetical protein
MQIAQARTGLGATACVNMTGNKKARRDAGLFDVFDLQPDRPIE